jgi:Holliday junction DNA helicase RuvA
MLYGVEGIIEDKNELFAVINAGGFLLRVFVPYSTFTKLPEKNEVCRLFIEMVIGEKMVRLYGFFTTEEKVLFNSLRKISKIGAQTALSVLSSLSVDQFYQAISRKDEKMLTSIPGIGKKTALSMIVEFSSKLPQSETVDNIVLDAALALEGMGFDKAQSIKLSQKICESNPDITIENLIKEALKQSKKDVY